jgi:hypothetical protein
MTIDDEPSAANIMGIQRRRKNSLAKEQASAIRVLDHGYTLERAAIEVGIGVNVVKMAVAREEGRREQRVERADLSMTAQEKFDVAVRQYKRKLDMEFEQRVRDDVRRRIDEIILPHWKQRIDQAQKLYQHRRGAMDKLTFNAIRRALHPDSRRSISDKVLAEAFDTFMRLEKFLLNEKDSPTEIGNLPDTLAEWDKMRATAKAMRRRSDKNAMMRK